MSFPGKLLLLSVKTQILWTIITLSAIAVILIYIIINIYIYEMKEQSIQYYTEYYYSIQKEILENIITFQNIFLFNYEDNLKILSCQLTLLLDISHYFNQSYSNSFFNISLNYLNKSDYLDTIYNFSNESNLNAFYINDINYDNSNKENNDHLNLVFRIIKAFKSLRIPYYGDYQLLEGVVFYLNRTKQLLSLNGSMLYEYITNVIVSDNLNEYYMNLTNNITSEYTLSLKKIINDNTIYPELTLPKDILTYINNYKTNLDIKIFSKYTPYLDYKKELLHLIKIEDENDELFVTIKLKSGFIDEIFLKMMGFFNITTLLITPEDNNIINILSCQALLIKTHFHSLIEDSENNVQIITETIKKIQKLYLENNITIDKCILNIENKNEEKYYREYLIHNSSFFYDIKTGYNISFIQLTNYNIENEYMVQRYTYPDYFLLERKRPPYLITNYLNVYTFMNFYFPFSYIDEKTDYIISTFYTITLGSWQVWMIIFFIISILCLKISKDITDPLIKLKKAIDQMSFTDKTIFEYKDDDNINELFTMCKDLVDKDEFKKSLQENSYIDDKKVKEEENKNYFNGLDNEEEGVIKRVNRNLLLNNQFFEKNRKVYNQKNKVSFNKEIMVYKDFKYMPKNRPRNLSRKRPGTINKLINKKLNLDNTLKSIYRLKTKEDYNINSKLRDNFLRDSLISSKTKKNSRVSFDEPAIKEKGNKNDNELNILLYELLFYLGNNMFKTNDKEYVGRSKIFKMDSSVNSNNDLNSYNVSTKTIQKIEYQDNSSKYYNYAGPIFENNDNTNLIYTERKSNKNLDIKNNDKLLKEQYQIKFHKNDLYYKYLKAKSDWNNKFLKQFKIVNDLELDSTGMVELDDEDDHNNYLLKKTIKKKESLSNLIGTKRKSSLIKNKKKTDNNSPVRNIKNLKRSNTHKKSDKKKSIFLRQSISKPINIFGKEINTKQRKLGMRASVSASIDIKVKRGRGKTLEKIKRTKTIEDFHNN